MKKVENTVPKSVAIELEKKKSLTCRRHHLTSFMHLKRILTKDISPENLKGASIDVIRHYFGPTGKIYVHSGTFKSIFHSHGSHGHLRSTVSK